MKRNNIGITLLMAAALPISAMLAGCGGAKNDATTTSQPTVNLTSQVQLEQALAQDEKQYGATSEQVAADLIKLGDAYRRAGNYSSSLISLQRAVHIRQSQGPKQTLALAKAKNALGQTLIAQGNFKQAEQVLLESLSSEEAQKAPAGDLAETQNCLGQLYFEGGILPEAQQFLEKAAPAIKTAAGDNSTQYAEVQNNLASVYFAQKKYSQAEPMFQSSASAYEAAGGHDQPEVASCLNNLAETYRAEGKLDQAQTNYDQAVAIYRKLSTPLSPHPHLAACLNNEALLYQKQKMYDKAEPLYKEAVSIGETSKNSDRRDLANTYRNYSALLMATNRKPQADAMAAKMNTTLAAIQ